MDNESERIHAAPDGDASWIELRLDAKRDISMMVQRNVSKHIHVSLGKQGKAVLILHPHAARRLVMNINAVLDGAEMAHG